ncbi:MAG: tetratricopeptide repeat protein, partial [Chloroflexi bacterium]|nr:tetratricopeptide repeat protein [Chloroflexota bacterium]
SKGVGGGRGTGAGSGERGAGENDEPERRTIGSAATPADSRLPTPDSLRRYAAVELFLARARAVRPALTLTPETAGDVAAICTLLDGLPLAIELAAARVNVFSVQEIADRLGDRLALLTGGYRDLPARHRTLRAAIDWSYELLSDEEQHLFRLLSIFGGGCTLDALEHVTGESGALETPIPAGSRPPAADFQLPTPLADLLGRLIDHSLIRRREDPDGTSRFRMLETIREFAGERLDAAGGGEDARLRHAAWFVALSDLMQSKWTTPEELPWLARLDAEYDNLRGVLQWTLDHGRAPLGLEIAGGLARFWSIRGLLREGRDRLEGLLARGGHAPPRVRAAAVSLEGALALARETDDHSLAGDALVLLGINRWRRSDFGGATASLEEALAIARAIGRTGLISRCLNNLGVIMIDQGRLETARAYLEEGLVIAREAGDARGIAARLNNLAMVTIRTGDLPLARVYAEEALAVDRGQGNAGFISIHLRRLGEIVLAQGNIEAALRYATEALAAAREVGNLFEVAEALDHLARVAYQRPDMAAAGRYARESLRIAHELDTPRQIWMAMDRLGHVARGAGEHDRAVRLYAAAGAVRATTGEVSAETSEREIAEYLTDLRGEHGDEFVSGPWTENAALSREQAIAYALTDAVAEPDVSDDLDDVAPPVSRYPRGAHPSARSAPYPDGLTEREVQVLRLLAAGLSNRAIAERLVVSERAVKHHIASLSRKTGTGGRVDAAAYAHRHQLVGA